MKNTLKSALRSPLKGALGETFGPPVITGPILVASPAITGTPERGEVLSCSTGTWTGDGTITYAYQWRRNGSPIGGATASTYTLVTADDNANIVCTVTATDNNGSTNANSNSVLALGAPLNLVAPVLSGTETVGETLSVTDGTWQGAATITYAYQWQRDGVNIGGATSSTYTLVSADYNTAIDCDVTATNSLDSATEASNATGAIAGTLPVNTVAPVASGDTGLGDVLSVTDGTWTGVPTPTFSYQWRRGGVNIGGATSSTYTIVQADSAALVDCVVTGTNAVGSAGEDSNDITVETFAAPVISGVPTISGSTTEGSVLTATASSVTGNPTPTVSWQWQRGTTDISGATSSTYTLVSADVGNTVRVIQTETNALGSDDSTSANTAVITAPSSIITPDEVDLLLTSTLGGSDQTWNSENGDLALVLGNSTSPGTNDPTIVTTANEQHLAFDGGDVMSTGNSTDPTWITNAHKDTGKFTFIASIRTPTSNSTQLKRLITNRSTNAGFEVFIRMNGTGSFMRLTTEGANGGANLTLSSSTFTLPTNGDIIIGVSWDIATQKATFFGGGSSLLEEQTGSITYPTPNDDPQSLVYFTNTTALAGQMNAGYRWYDACFTDTYIPSTDTSEWSSIETNMAGLKTGITF